MVGEEEVEGEGEEFGEEVSLIFIRTPTLFCNQLTVGQQSTSDLRDLGFRKFKWENTRE